ncbi:MAG TPA: YARHG domain-containing protein [Bauldia sp.]|nr:YARHG domain-containing protein [Bauldia sp.]
MQEIGIGKVSRLAAVTVAALGILLEAGTIAAAQNYAAMTCSQLWYARNAIYAENGYCFKTARARAVFGPGCFAPYGKLSSYEQQQVNEIQYWENRKGC